MLADEQGLVKRQTVQSMVRAWDAASTAIRESYELIHAAMSNLDVAFMTDHGLHIRVRDEVIECLRRQCWRVIVARGFDWLKALKNHGIMLAPLCHPNAELSVSYIGNRRLITRCKTCGNIFTVLTLAYE